MHAGRFALFSVLVGSLILALPASATAQARSPEAIQITTHATNGYGLALSGEVEGRHSTVTLSTGKPITTAAYSVDGTITPTRVQASFGRYGSVSLQLVRYKVRRIRLSRSCRLPGSPAVSEVRIGTFVGHIRFRGEHGFSTASAYRARGAVGEPTALAAATLPGPHTRLFCLSGLGPQSGAQGPGPVTLHASSMDGAVAFLAFSDPASTSDADSPKRPSHAQLHLGATTFVASESEQRGKVQISRSVVASALMADFSFDPLFATATVTPPAPFHGRATFQRGVDGSVTWSGSLTASFPGAPNVALAGPHFETDLGDEEETSGESCAEFPANRPC